MTTATTADGKRDRGPGCPGSYRQRTIEVDCERCQGRQDLTDRTCLVGALRLLAKHPSAERIELLGAWEVRYDRNVIETLYPLVRILQALEAIGSASQDGRICHQCDASPAKVTSRILSRFPARPTPEDIGSSMSKSRNRDCDSCLNRTRVAISAAGREYGKFESSLAKRAFKVVGGVSDAGDPSEGSGAQTGRR
ncbi:MAG: hypothetical protein LUO79_04335 [Methanomassiliicoccales archaeon]|nr:hypothetical protein [Methanomassiliicoccales archaeon]